MATAEVMTGEQHQLQAMATMPENVVLLKMENEQIFAVAKAQPREPAKIVQQLRDLIEAYPAAAAGAIYSKPVGTVQEVTCGKCGIKYQVPKVDAETQCVACDSRDKKDVRPVKKFAEGLSIRAAETIRSIYGYTRLATTTEVIDGDKVRITGTVVDYASGNITSDERIVSPWYKDRYGKMTKTPEDRFLNVAVKAEKSKLRRDIILDNTPAIVKTAFRDMCDEKNGLLVTSEEIEQKIIPAFATFGLTPGHLDKIIGRPRSSGWTEDDRLQLRKILVALKQEETTVRELLDGLNGAPAAASKVPNAGASVEDLVGGAKEPTPPPPGVSKPSPPPPPPQKKAAQATAENHEPRSEREPGEDDAAPASQVDAEQWLADWGDVLQAVETITQCAELERDQLGKIPAVVREKALEMLLARKEAIRGKRGQRSNGQ